MSAYMRQQQMVERIKHDLVDRIAFCNRVCKLPHDPERKTAILTSINNYATAMAKPESTKEERNAKREAKRVAASFETAEVEVLHLLGLTIGQLMLLTDGNVDIRITTGGVILS